MLTSALMVHLCKPGCLEKVMRVEGWCEEPTLPAACDEESSGSEASMKGIFARVIIGIAQRTQSQESDQEVSC